MAILKEAAVSGQFYPSSPEQLANDVKAYIHQATTANEPPPEAIIAPHAGYIYSGPIAGSAYAPLAQLRNEIKQVAVLAPAHRVAVSGLALCNATHFETPLGVIPVSMSTVKALSDLPDVEFVDPAFAHEHAIEVQLPFLQETLGEFELVPILVGLADPKLVERAIDMLWGEPSTMMVISSDLSHFLDYESAKAMDKQATQAIETLEYQALSNHHACGSLAIKGLLMSAQKRGLKARTVDLRNSGDTQGDKQRVVGYGAYLFNTQN